MIQYADKTSELVVRNMWTISFDDSEAYMDIYFREKYRPENTLIYYHEGVAAASLQMLPFRFTFWQREIPVVYFSGLCTLPEFRRRGFMDELIRRSFDEIGRNGIPLAVLIPQNDAVMHYYEKSGFVQTFEAGQPQPSLKKLMRNHRGNLESAYREFDANYRHRDMTVQKTFADFRAIVEEAELYGFPEKSSLTGMSRIIDAGKLLDIFAGANADKNFSLSVSDNILPQNSAIFSVEKGKSGKVEEKRIPPGYNLIVDIKELPQLLSGYRIDEKTASFRNLFPEKNPLICFMLE